MTNKIIAQTTIKDCTIFKLGGSYAVSLNKEHLEKSGFNIGMPVDVTLKLYDDAFEPIQDYSDEIAELEPFIKDFENQPMEEINYMADLFGFIKFNSKTESEEQYKKEIKKELADQLRFMKKEQKQNEYAMDNYDPGDFEDQMDYDKQGEKLLNSI